MLFSRVGRGCETSWFEGKHVVGVTAGASTPDWVIKEVVGKVEEIEKTNLELKPEELQEEHGQEKSDAEQSETVAPEISPETPQGDVSVTDEEKGSEEETTGGRT